MKRLKKDLEEAVKPSYLKIKNRKAVLKQLRQNDLISIAEIGKNLGMSRQTVTKGIDFFLSKGIATDRGKGDSTNFGGKCPVLYSLDTEAYVLCVCLRRKYISLVLSDLHCKQCFRWDSNKKDLSHVNVLFGIIEEGYDIIKKKFGESINISGVSVSLPGRMSSENFGTLLASPVFPTWGNNVPIYEPLAKIFSNVKYFSFNHDATLTTFAARDKYFEKCKNNDVLVMYTGDGISGGYIIKGDIYSQRTKAFGNIIVKVDEAHENKNIHGYLEDIIGPKALRKSIIEKKNEYTDSSLCKIDINEVTFKALFEASEKGDELARIITRYYAKYFSIGLLNISVCLLPRLIIILGNYGLADSYFKEHLVNGLKEHKILNSLFDPEDDGVFIYDNETIEYMEELGATIVIVDEIFNDDQLYYD